VLDWAHSLLADVKLELEDDFNDPRELQIVGKAPVEEKAKLKDGDQGLLDRPLRAFANCVQCEGNLNTQYVQDGPDLWEAGQHNVLH
jgi:hypothetical protein